LAAIVPWQNVTDAVAYRTEVCLYEDAIGENTCKKTGWFCSTHFMQPIPHSNAEMEQILSQIDVAKLK